MTACAAQGAMGIIGAAVGSTLITGLLLLIGGTQSGCDPIVTACLSQEPSGYEIGPCLSAPPAGEMAGEMAGEIGPCLDVLPPDMGPPMDTDAGEPDAGMPGEKMGKATQGDRQDAVERLAQRGSLPEDVLARLRSRG